ncbi:TPA: virB8 family protein [Legionella pneumophila]
MNLFKKSTSTHQSTDYFQEAKSWSDDRYGSAIQSRNRYQIAFIASMILNGLSLIAVACLAPMQTLVPLMVHHYDNGVTTVEPLEHAPMPSNKAQIESDLIRYITNRESYDVSSYRSQYDLVALLSNESVLKEYSQEQDKASSQSPIHILGATGSRSVHVYSINFLDDLNLNERDLSKNHHNLAEIVFTLTDTDKASGRATEKHYNALISWSYITPSSDPSVRWRNWDGFLVTRYSKQARNV